MRNIKMEQSPVQLYTNYNDIIRYRKYFGALSGTSIIRADTFYLYKQGVGEVDKNISTGSSVTLKECDVSLFGQNGVIPNAESFLVQAIGVDCKISNSQATTPFTNDAVTSINITPAILPNPTALLQNILDMSTFTLYRNSTELLEQGNLRDYPSGLCEKADGGGQIEVVPAITQGTAAGLQTTYTHNPWVFIQNGFAFRELTVWQEFQPLDQFYAELKVCREIDLSSTLLTGYIDFLLIGRATVKRDAGQMLQSWT